MSKLFITTSRRTSNRVRTFIRDLCTVIPGLERFNRGGMSLSELISKIKQSSAIGALIISMYRGNPGTMQLLSPDGTEVIHIKMESALLKREIQPINETRIKSIRKIYVQTGSSEETMLIASMIADIVGLSPVPITSIADFDAGIANASYMWFQDYSDGKTLWTHYNSHT
ncbi:MAG: hypothetical protein ACTSUO_07200, partial [Candidatus Thorarchaeota archaeon]